MARPWGWIEDVVNERDHRLDWKLVYIDCAFFIRIFFSYFWLSVLFALVRTWSSIGLRPRPHGRRGGPC